MKITHCLVSILAIASIACAEAGDSKGKKKTLVDFTRQEVEFAAGTTTPIRKYDYSFESWQDKLIFLDGKGILIPALSGKGGLGKDDRLKFGPSMVAEIEIAIGNRNESDSFTVSMVDADGTEASWYLSLKDKPRGVSITYPLQLDKPDQEDKPGKKPGFDKNKIKSWQIKGNWQDSKIEILLIKISAGPA